MIWQPGVKTSFIYCDGDHDPLVCLGCSWDITTNDNGDDNTRKDAGR